MSTDTNRVTAAQKLQKASDAVYKWTTKWKIKLNETKSTYVNFSNQNLTDPAVININGTGVPYANIAKYLGMTLDTKLKWNEHVRKKVKELKIKIAQYRWLIGRHSKMTLYNKLLIYKQVIKPTWLYGIQLWGCTKSTHIKKIQTVQNKVLREIANAPWFVRNNDLLRDLRILTVEQAIK
ncbi:hypothetical protein YQE_01432, partial [Dendroctonus ponderosae]